MDANLLPGDCIGLIGASFHSVSVGGVYPFTVELAAGFVTQILTLADGAISQPMTGTDITVTNSFAWTKGILNSSSNLANLTVSGGTAVIDPQGLTLNTGSNLNFTGTTAPVDATIQSGTTNFNNAAGAVVGVGIWAQPATVTVLGNIDTSGSGRITVNAGGTYLVSPPGAATRTSALPILVNGGLLKVVGGVTASFTGQFVHPNFPAAGGWGVQMAAGRIQIQAGSTIDAANNIHLFGGSLITLPVQGANTATLRTNVLRTEGADIYINHDPDLPIPSPYVAGILHVTGAVDWSAGTYRPVVDMGQYAADCWTCADSFSIGGTAKIAPGTVNVTPGVNWDGRTYDVIRSATRIFGQILAPESDYIHYEMLTVSKGL